MIRDRNASLDELVRSAIAPIVARLAQQIGKHIAQLTARRVAAELSRRPPRATRATRAASPSRRRRAAELTRWVADRRARRVPTFVIEATGLETKKEIVARFGPNAAFERGKALPAEAKGADATREVKAKPPIIRRKNGKAAA